MNLTLVISKNCTTCKKAEKVLQNFQQVYSFLKIETIDLSFVKDQKIQIIPALIINDKLFSYGEIDEKKLSSILNIAVLSYQK